MDLKEIILGQESCEKLGQIDESIRARSLEIGTHLLRLRAAEDQLKGLYESRQAMINELIKGDGYDLARVHSQTIMPNGDDPMAAKLAFMYRPE